MTNLIPRVKISDKATQEVCKFPSVNTISVSLQDFISPQTFKFNSYFFKVKNEGGIHNSLNYSGKVWLSTTVKDKLIANIGPETYAEIIDTIKPDASTTVDAETYQNETYWHDGKLHFNGREVCEKEILRCYSETKELISLCPSTKFIGLMKGSTPNQIRKHLKLLKGLGVTEFMLHVGDFFRYSSPKMMAIVKNYASIVRSEAEKLHLYGMSSQKRIGEFSFADSFVSFGHFVTARNGMCYIGTRKQSYSGGYNPKLMLWNFLQMQRNIAKLKYQKSLLDYMEEEIWEEATIPAELVTPAEAAVPTVL